MRVGILTTLFSKIKQHGRLIASIYDLCAVIAAWLLAFLVLIDAMTVLNHQSRWTLITLYSTTIGFDIFWILTIQFLLFRFFGLYRGFWRFASVQDLQKIAYATLLGSLALFIILQGRMTLLDDHLVLPPLSLALLYNIFLIILLSAARLLIRLAKDYKRIYQNDQRVIIVGAGNAGEGLVRDLLRSHSHPYKPILFVDDDISKIGCEIHGIRVSGTLNNLPDLIRTHNIELVLIAIPSASSAGMRSVVEICEKSNVCCYTLPGIKDLANGHVSINKLRNISLEDLLGRYPVDCQLSDIQFKLKNKTILVTGGGGSIGSELFRQLANLGESLKLIIVDSNEYNLYAIEMEFQQHFPAVTLCPILLNVTDRAGVQSLLEKYHPNIVFHAAAYKHVPMLEHQPRAAIYNNVIGTFVMAEEAARAHVETFVLISTDKAVNPTNIMGATKRAAEYFCQNLNNQQILTKFITVRFGNVLDSAGSVVPLFRKQIESGGPVTVTHPDITRYFMTIPEAAQLILQAAFLGEGGEIFVLDMGEPIKIRYLAEQMIKMTDKVINRDINIIYTGLRPGEKLYEEYFYPNEVLQPTSHAKILRAKSHHRNFKEIKWLCECLVDLCHHRYASEKELIGLLKKFVPEYQPPSNLQDIKIQQVNFDQKEKCLSYQFSLTV